MSFSTTHLFPDIDGSLGNLTILGFRIFFQFCEVISFPRQQIQVDEIFVHENYTVTGNKANDIALLRLGEKSWIFLSYPSKAHIICLILPSFHSTIYKKTF